MEGGGTRKTLVPENREICQFPPPFSRRATPYAQSKFSPSTVNLAARSRSSLASKLAKMIVLGDVGVGKTCIVNRFCHRVFDANYKATIGVDFELERFRVLDVAFNLQIWDTAGQERFKCIAKSYYRDANVIALVFDVTDLQTLDNAKKWLDDASEVNSSFCSRFPPSIFLIGAKKDLLSETSLEEVFDRAAAAASKMRAELWLVSSKSGSTVDDFFLRIAALAFDSVMMKKAADDNEMGCITIGDTSKISLDRNDLYETKRKHFCAGAADCRY